MKHSDSGRIPSSANSGIQLGLLSDLTPNKLRLTKAPFPPLPLAAPVGTVPVPLSFYSFASLLSKVVGEDVDTNRANPNEVSCASESLHSRWRYRSILNSCTGSWQ